MARKKDRRDRQDDDGRTIADMSGVERRSLFGFAPVRRELDGKRDAAEQDDGDDRPWEERSLNREETGHFILGALGAGLLIALIFIGAAAIFITLLLLFWK